MLLISATIQAIHIISKAAILPSILLPLKYKDFSKFYQMLLLLSGNIRLNLAPAPNGVSHYSWKSFENEGPHFIHWNVISILSKEDELKTIAGNTKIAVIGEMESNFSTLCI